MQGERKGGGSPDECEPMAGGAQGARMGQGLEGGGVEREGEGAGVTVVKGKCLGGSATAVGCDPGDCCPGGVGTTECPDDKSQGMSGDRGSSTCPLQLASCPAEGFVFNLLTMFQ